MNKKVLFLTQAGLIAALYVVLTLLANALGLANYAIQIRFSEALTILPFFTPAAIPGLLIGCLLSNWLTDCIIWDIIFGSLATLLGAIGTYLIAHGKSAGTKSTLVRELCCTLPPILSNTIIVPFILAYAYHFEGGVPFFMLTVCIGEVISCGILGFLLMQTLKKYRRHIFQTT
ncbi:MAG: QueT transporter family protein [Lachnospiraceae bacterium]|jgi:uncharacterized membrane protein|nr:QueT transporter family protein [Lachnospiraceae bacterium]